jgi:hypothetical protein
MKQNFRIRTVCVIALLSTASFIRPDNLQQILEKSVKDFHGVAGIYVYSHGKKYCGGCQRRFHISDCQHDQGTNIVYPLG